MTLHDHFERVVVLNLRYREDRLARFLKGAQASGMLTPSKITVIPAVSGDQCPPPAWWNAGNGAWGCMLSHHRVVCDAIGDNLESVLILEDDAIFDPKASIDTLPETWGQIYLGGQHLRKPEVCFRRERWLVCSNVNRTHAYALHRSAMAKFAAHIMHAPDYIARGAWHIDHQLGVAHERGDWPVFAPRWWVAGQAEGSSNVSGATNPAQWWQYYDKPTEGIPLIVRRADTGIVALERALSRPGSMAPYLENLRADAAGRRDVPEISHPHLEESHLASWKGPVVYSPSPEQARKLRRTSLRLYRAAFSYTTP